MNLSYITLTKEFLVSTGGKKFASTLLKILKERAEDTGGNRDISKLIKCDIHDIVFVHYYHYCPYCKEQLLLTMGYPKKSDHPELKYCTKCGESNPYEKAINSLNRMSSLINLYKQIKDVKKYKFESKTALLHQGVIALVTCLEVFLRDVYTSSLNMKYIKSDESLIERFFKEAKNDFLNLGKTRARFKSELDYDITEKMDKSKLDDLNLLFLYRNVLVHNNGIVDKSFSSQSRLGLKVGSEVEITLDFIENSMLIAVELINNIGEVYLRELEQEVKFSLTSNIMELLKNHIMETNFVKYKNEIYS